MRGQPSTTKPLAILAAPAILLVCGELAAQTMIPLDQQRMVSTFLIVPQCLGKTADVDSAEGFDPFDSAVETVLGCDSGFGFGSGSQQSQIGASSLTAIGSGSSQADGPVPNIIHAFGDSFFMVTFELPSASNYALDGLISAASSKDPFIFAGATILLRDSANKVLFIHSVEPGPGGEPNSQVIEKTGALQAGVYTLQADAGSFIDNDVPPLLSGEASFDFTFQISVVGDLDSDGTVGILDLLILLSSWGPCPDPPEPCPADLDDDGEVAVLDLLILLANWG
ncbi:MAG: hypothetical protein IH830_05420 [Planctomycetes bacterium]|nr:hypothetical protein [Planctomycetota bacterium]